MGLNRSCYKDIALDTLVRGSGGLPPQLGHRERSSRYPGQVRLSRVSVGFNLKIHCNEQLHLRPKSDNKFREKNCVAHCKPTIVGELVLDLFVHLHFSYFGDLVIPFLQPIWSIVIQRFGDQFGDRKNSEKRVSIKRTPTLPPIPAESDILMVQKYLLVQKCPLLHSEISTDK